MPKEPTPQDLVKPEFNVIWEAIKGWDLERVPGEGYAATTGTDVMTILNSLENIMVPATNVNLSIKCHSCGREIHINRPITGSLRCVCRTYVVQTCNEGDKYQDGGG